MLVGASIWFLFPAPNRGAAMTLAQLTLPWGETLTVPTWTRPPMVAAPIYLVVASVNVFVLLGAVHLFQRDRVGGLLIGLGGATGLVTTMAGLAADFGWMALPYMGDLPFAFWVVMIATQLARENAQSRQQHSSTISACGRSSITRCTSSGLLDVDGTVLEANRPVLEAVGVTAEAVVGRKFWETAIWAHSEELRVRVHQACLAAAKGETVRFETAHPLPSGGVGYVDFSLKPIRDEQGVVILLVPEGRDITERKKTQAALNRLVDVIGPQTGQDFFQTAVDSLCAICEAEFAFVAALDPTTPSTVRTIAVSKEGKCDDNFTYDLNGTPCATIIGRSLCYFPSDVRTRFPDDA
ncbi:MAG: PAS domain-containing protein [Vicinamibacterales bacterium]